MEKVVLSIGSHVSYDLHEEKEIKGARSTISLHQQEQ